MKKQSVKKILFCTSLLLLFGASGCSKPAENEGGNAISSERVEEAIASQPFPAFQGKDLDGTAVDASVFGEHEATVVNFWFTGCPACIDEMPALDQLAQELKEKDVAFSGLLVERGKEDEAREILNTKGANYRNIVPEAGEEMDAFLQTIFAFPTTVVVDREGNIVGDAVVGALTAEGQTEKLMEQVDKVLERQIKK